MTFTAINMPGQWPSIAPKNSVRLHQPGKCTLKVQKKYRKCRKETNPSDKDYDAQHS
jgi:hypothetical protein